MTRSQLLQKLAEIITGIKTDRPLRVSIDGPDASGKTTLANDLAEELKKSPRHIIRASIDRFHNPKATRYQKGRNSAEGYYFDSFSHEAIIQNLLEPLGPNGNLQYKTAVFDFRTDKKIESPTEQAQKDSILIMEGVFMSRPELSKYWDLKIFVDANFETTLKRVIKQDGAYLGSEQETTEMYQQRYIPGQKLYFKETNPREKADIVVDNNDFERPEITKSTF